MANWKKIIVSGSNAHLSSVTASNGSIVSGSLTMSGSITNVDHLNFHTTSSVATTTGRLVWNDGDGTLDLGLKGGTLALQLGQDSFARVYNAEATTLNKGEIVYISGSQGNRISVKRADNDIEAGSANTLGMVSENISSGAEGFVFTSGIVNGLNTIGLTAGATLYLSSSGQYTQTPPVAPKHTVIIGFVERVHATVGSIFVKVNNGYELGELHNVLTNGANYGDLLMYSASVWTHSKQLSGSYGLTGSLQATSFTGSLQGTASNAISSSYAVTSSFASSSPAVYDFGSFATPTDVGGGGNFGIVTDGDKGDITVTSSGSIWTIDNDAVTYAKIQNVTTSSVLLGRATTGAGNIEEIILGSGLTMSGTTLSAAGGGAGMQVQIDTITTSSTWTPPAWGKYFKVYLVGGGGGAGSGARQATTSTRYGGGGGAPASSVWVELNNTQVTGSVSVTIGAGGAGGTSITTDNTNGNNGSPGGATSFGSFTSTYTSGGGNGGTTSSGNRGAAISVISNFAPSSTLGGQNGSNGSPGTVSGVSNQSLSYTGNFGGAGGAGAAGSSTTTANGGTIDYWSVILPSVSVSTGGTNGGNGNDGVSFTYSYLTVGTPGGGGSYKTGQATGRGGDGSYGAGGGGGAASDNGYASGRGGNGGNGICIIVSIG